VDGSKLRQISLFFAQLVPQSGVARSVVFGLLGGFFCLLTFDLLEEGAAFEFELWVFVGRELLAVFGEDGVADDGRA
jgi:hypothetical protein